MRHPVADHGTLLSGSYLGRFLSKREEKTLIPICLASLLFESLMGTINIRRFAPHSLLCRHKSLCLTRTRRWPDHFSRLFGDDRQPLNARGSALAQCLDVTEEDPLLLACYARPAAAARPSIVCRQATNRPPRRQPRSTWRRPVEAREAFESSRPSSRDRERNSRNNIGGKTSVVAVLIQLHLRRDCSTTIFTSVEDTKSMDHVWPSSSNDH